LIVITVAHNDSPFFVYTGYLVIATLTITQKNKTPRAGPFSARQPLQVYSTKPSPSMGMKSGLISFLL
jgi:hypothetical protein